MAAPWRFLAPQCGVPLPYLRGPACDAVAVPVSLAPSQAGMSIGVFIPEGHDSPGVAQRLQQKTQISYLRYN